MTRTFGARISSFMRTRSDPLMVVLLCSDEFFPNFVNKLLNKIRCRDRSTIALLVLADRYGIGRLFLFADDKHIGHLLRFPVADLVSYFFVSFVKLAANPCLFQHA